MADDILVLDDATAPLDRQRRTGLRLLVALEDHTTSHDLPAAGKVTIGRGEDNDIRVEHPSVSRKHAVLEIDEQRLRVRDLGSANGTRVSRRNVPAGKPVEVGPGEVIEIGGVCLLVHDAARGMERRACTQEPAKSQGRPIVLEDPAMKSLFQLVARIAPSDLSVLVLGETGVGKEVVAESVHSLSARTSGPLLKLNCGALPRTLLESELFGHEKGAFTGATESKPGLFETASGGTVFLDEIGEVPQDIQVALLRVVEDRKVLRIGGREPRSVDVRFVAATNRDLRCDVNAGSFRRDLYFRLAGVTIVVPPLRSRLLEIPALAKLFAARVAQSLGFAAPRICLDTLAALERYSWPGNVRELRNVIERAIVLAAGGEVQPACLPPELLGSSALVPPGEALTLRSELDEIERRRILDALERCSGNQTRAAAELRMPRRTFLKRLDAYGIRRPRKKPRATLG